MESFRTTYVVPTYNRSKEFIDAYSYFVTMKDSNKIKVIVVDGSNNEYDLAKKREFCEKNGFEYYRFVSECNEENTAFNKAIFGLKKVKTATAKLCDDEDIASATASIECAEFLEKNEGYASAAGKYKSCTISSNKLTIRDCYCGEGLEQDDALARLWSLLFFYHESPFYNVYRTEALLEALERTVATVPEKSHLLLDERVFCSISVMLGKVKRLDIDYCIRISNKEQQSVYDTLTSQFYGPLKTLAFKKISHEVHTVDYSFTPTDTVKLMRDILKCYIEPYDDIQHDILTVILSSHLSSNNLTHREMRKFKSYIKEKEFDISLYKIIDEIFAQPAQVYFSYIPNPRFKGRVAMYGAGRLGKLLCEHIENNGEVKLDCFIDKDFETLGTCLGYKVVSPSESGNLNVDYIAIANNRVGDEIYESLLGYGVDKSKIVSFEEFTKESPIFTYRDYWEKSFGS